MQCVLNILSFMISAICDFVKFLYDNVVIGVIIVIAVAVVVVVSGFDGFDGFGKINNVIGWAGGTSLVTYKIHESSLDEGFVKQTSKIIRSSKWNELYNIREVSDDAIINIYLESDEAMEPYHTAKEYHEDGTEVRFSITYQGKKTKPIILINYKNWKSGVPQSKLNLEDYREYVINHEFGHALGYDHLPCNAGTAVDGVCPVMYQSTRGCGDMKCGKIPNIMDMKAAKLSMAYID